MYMVRETIGIWLDWIQSYDSCGKYPVKRGTVLLNADVQVKWKKIKGDLKLIEHWESIM